MSTIDLYAVLGVARDASADDIRAAWTKAVTGLGPTDPSFNVFNQAGAVLLDGKRRAAYDAELADSEASASGDVPAGVSEAGTAPGPARLRARSLTPSSAGGAQPRADLADHGEAAAAVSAGPGKVLVGVLAILVVGVVLAAIFAAGAIGRALPDRGVSSEQERLADAVSSAEAAAVPVLSYDYRHLAEDKKAASARLTDSFRKDYEQTFALIEQNAPETQAVVAVKVVASAVAGATDKGVDVLLFVDRPTTKKGSKEPDVFRDQVTFSMRLVEGKWLVNDMRVRRPA